MGEQPDGRHEPRVIEQNTETETPRVAPAGPRVAAEEPLTFPDAPRLGLDRLLGQMVEHAQEVLDTQGRLRGLLRANRVVTSDLTLPAVLRHVVEAARDLVGARYAALGVIAPDGSLAEFIHRGMPPETVRRIGHLPQGKGLLGALIADPHPIRLDRIEDDDRSSGFPEGHPEMHGFLGVPIRARSTVFGNLYLAESVRGRFSAEDEELATALASTAGVAIENARLFASAQSRQDWLQASAAITREILTPATSDPLGLVAEHGRRTSNADIVTISRPDDDRRRLRVEVAAGPAAAALLGTGVPIHDSLSGQVYTTGRPLLGTWPQEQSSATADAPTGMDIESILIVPLSDQRVTGTITAARRHGRPAFTAEDLDMAASFAHQACIAIELADARAEQQRVAVFDERERIAADLHDSVIQRLFATILSLQGTVSGLGSNPAAERLLGTIDDLDATIGQIRNTIFQLGRITPLADISLRGRLLDVVTDMTQTLGFAPSVRFAGQLESNATPTLAVDLLAALGEALNDIAQHANATHADVEITAHDEQITLGITDNGIDPTERHSGPTEARTRAESHGGRRTLAPHHPTGSVLTWHLPYFP
ncbi:sensor histidine kinase [Amycolatopsis orientalis]|uniref:sensor histidine kinase n=1 Tax=Amycolatopsis orientalis TaxID=31958 RepID=UPI00040CCFFF|nr:GAF domain-containing protein [Amycolatopsis orientalis]